MGVGGLGRLEVKEVTQKTIHNKRKEKHIHIQRHSLTLELKGRQACAHFDISITVSSHFLHQTIDCTEGLRRTHSGMPAGNRLTAKVIIRSARRVLLRCRREVT